MKCPVCDERLVEVQKGGVFVDLCPSCKGAWVEREEMAKVLSVISGEAPGAAHAIAGADDRDGIDEDRQRQQRRSRDVRDDDDDDDEHYDGRSDKYGRKRKRGGFLDSISDMFGG